MSKSKRKTQADALTARASQPDAGDPIVEVLRALLVGLLVVRWLIPAETAGGGDTLWLVQLAFAAVIVWTWSCLRRSNFEVRSSLFDVALWTLVGAHILSAAYVFVSGGERRTALNLAWEWIGLGAIWFLLRQTIRTPLEARRLASVIVALGVVLGGLGIWQHYVFYRVASNEYLSLIHEYDELRKDPNSNPSRLRKVQLTIQAQGIPLDEEGRQQYENRLRFSNEAFGPFALANTFAGWLIVAIVLAAELFRTIRSPRSKSAIAAWAAALLVLLYCLILTKSRSAWGALVIACGLWGAWQAVRNRQLVTKRLLLATGIGSLTVVVLFALAYFGKGVDVQVISESSKSLSYRFHYWVGASRTIAKSPLMGTGLGNFRHPYLRYKLAESSEEIADPHNCLLDLWANGGLLAVGSFLACVVLAVAPAKRRLAESSPNAARQFDADFGSAENSEMPPWSADILGPSLGFVFAILAPVLAATGLFDSWQIVLWIAWVIVFFILRRDIGSSGLANVALAAAALGLLIHLTVAGGIEMPAIMLLLLVLAAFHFATREQQTPPIESRRAVLVIGAGAVIGFSALFVSGTLPVLNRRAAIAAGDQLLTTQFDQATIDYARAALEDPFSPEGQDKLADAYFARWQSSPQGLTRDSFDKARAALQVAIHLDPANSTRYRRLGTFYLARFARSQDPQDAGHAAAAFFKAIDLYPTEAALRGQCATALADAGKSDEAKMQAQRALELDGINHQWGHTDRYLPLETVTRLKRLADGQKP